MCCLGIGLAPVGLLLGFGPCYGFGLNLAICLSQVILSVFILVCWCSGIFPCLCIKPSPTLVFVLSVQILLWVWVFNWFFFPLAFDSVMSWFWYESGHSFILSKSWSVPDIALGLGLYLVLPWSWLRFHLGIYLCYEVSLGIV